MRLTQTTPALPVAAVASAVAFYRDRLGFRARHEEEGFAIVVRDEAELHLWHAGDDSWRGRDSLERPIRSGAESFLAGTASCRIRVDDVDALWDELRRSEALHPVSKNGAADTGYGTREFAALDTDGNLLTFYTKA